MSQAGIISVAGSAPAVPEQFTTDSGIAIPVANNLNILGIDSSANNDNGISTSGAGATVDIILTNRQTGAVTTTDATPTTILTFPLGAIPGVYYIEGNIVAFDVTDTAGGAYTLSGAVRTTGAAGVAIGVPVITVVEEAALTTSSFAISVSVNNLIATVTGIAGKTIDWNAYLTYRFVS